MGKLVAYSGFSSSNYLQQPYNSDLDFGTGDFCVMGWAKGGNEAEALFTREQKSPFDQDGSLLVFQNSGNYFYYIRRDGSTGWDSLDTGTAYGNYWKFLTYIRKNGTIYGYTNGELKVTGSSSHNISNSDAVTTLGNRATSVSSQNFTGSLALWRISATAPSAEQIKKIYEDEKVLFQENAQATLYGSSDAVTALAYDDDTNLLSVGTSAGRSDFSGLRRVNNTTTAVTTAISSSNGMVVEQ